jgi:tRNA(Ile)-lysidine synthase
MVEIVDRFEQALIKYGLLTKEDRVLIALSGGPDSMALLHLFNLLRAKYNLTIAAAHLDHAIRPVSTRDRQFCRQACQALQIKFYSKRLNIPALAKRQGISLEEAGRAARYAYFDTLASKYKFNKIATGHTLDDAVETILFNLARGTGLSGLAGIPRKRDSIIRPLIDFEKKELLSWLKTVKVKYVQDTSNRSLAYARNRIRHKILPELEKINPAVRGNIARLSHIASEELEFIRDLAVSAYNEVLIEGGKSKIVLDLGKLTQYDKSLRKKVLKEAVKNLSGNAGNLSSDDFSRALGIIDGKSGGKTPLAGGIYIEKSQGRLALLKASSPFQGISLRIPGITPLPIGSIEAKIIPKIEMGALDRTNCNIYLDFNKMTNIAVTFHFDGAKIRPLGMSGHKLLSNIFIDCKIPEFERQSIPILLSGNEIAWIAGVMISENFKVTENTNEVLNLHYARSDN